MKKPNLSEAGKRAVAIQSLQRDSERSQEDTDRLQDEDAKLRRKAPAEGAVMQRAVAKATSSPKTEYPVSESDLLDRLTVWTGDREEAEYWYHKVPIPGFGHKTAEQVRAEGMGIALGHYIEGLLSGAFA